MNAAGTPGSAPAPAGESVHLRQVFLGLLLPLILYAMRSVEFLSSATIPYDTAHTYLPLAQRFLADPVAYFANPEAVKVAPGAVIYMALAGANAAAVKAANLSIALLSVVLMYDAARRVAGLVAGAAAAWGYALSHLLVEAGTNLMGEAPFVFLVALWLWASACAVGYWRSEAERHAPQRRRRQWGAVLLAGVPLAAATLTRATYLYWLPAASVLFFIGARWLQGERRAVAQRIASLHLVALVLVGGFMAYQQAQFDRPMVATGSGAALYFGSNPVLAGYEPPFFGLGHDEFTVTDALGHLSLEGDRRLMAVTQAALKDIPLATLAGMYVQKLGATLFFSRAHLPRYFWNDRAWRVALLVLAGVGVWWGRRKPLVWMVAGAAAYQCAVHIPVMYNPRYSMSALDVPLNLLGALGVAALWHQAARGRAIAATAGVMMLGMLLGAYHQRHSAPTLPDLNLGPHRLVQAAPRSALEVEGLDTDPFAGVATAASGHIRLAWHSDRFDFSSISVLRLAMRHLQGSCQRLEIFYTERGGNSRSALVRLDGLRAGQDIAWGMNGIKLPDPAGTLRLDFQCSPGARMQWGELGLYEASLGRFYRAQALP